MRVASMACLPLPYCCTSASFANRIGIKSSGSRYGLCTFRAGYACVAAEGEMETVRKPVVDKAVIVGGGLGGLAAAIQLRKVGIDAHVYERNIGVSGGEGTFLSVCPNGCRALSKADPEIVAKLREAGVVDMPVWTFDPKTGEKLATWELSQRMEETYGQPSIHLHWHRVLNVLSEALDDDCKHMGHECVDVSQDEEGATVQFKRGDEYISVKAPLVIGADGIHSVVRSKVFGPTPPRDHGRTMWRAVIDEHICRDMALEVGGMQAIGDGRTMFVVNGNHGKIYWAVTLADEYTDGRTKVRSKDSAELKARLRQEFEGWDLALKLIEVTDPEVILERRVLDLPVLSEWTRGRLALLGDAAHAVTPRIGQGANLAFEDGFELALQLSSASDLRCGLKAYEESRMFRTQLISENSQDMRAPIPQSFVDWLYGESPPSPPEQVSLV